MKASINTNAGTHELTITSHDLNWDELQQATFSEGEVQGRDRLKLIGQELTVPRLRSKAGDAPTREGEGKTSYRTDAAPGHYQTRYGAGVISRHL